MKSWSRMLDRRGWFLLAAILLLLASLFKPAAILPRPMHDWFFVVDITQSMNVQDYFRDGISSSRLAQVKLALHETLRQLPCGANVALGLFTERTVTPIIRPLEVCEHFTALDETVAGIDWRMAWAADSFITHGLFSGIEQTAKNGELFHLAFFTDGHQAPPTQPEYLPKFEAEPGSTSGIIFGVGSTTPSRIPKLDENDHVIGYWELEEVMRFATFGISRKTLSVEDMENFHGRNAPHGGNPAEQTNAHLSALDEQHLQQLAVTTGIDYARLTTPGAAAKRLTSQSMANWRQADTDLRPLLVIPALLLVIGFYLPQSVFRRIRQRFLSWRKQ